jgi:hypothetical protein
VNVKTPGIGCLVLKTMYLANALPSVETMRDSQPRSTALICLLLDQIGAREREPRGAS